MIQVFARIQSARLETVACVAVGFRSLVHFKSMNGGVAGNAGARPFTPASFAH